MKIKQIKTYDLFDFFGGDLNHDLNQWFKSNDLNQTTHFYITDSVSLSETDTVSYVKMMYFTIILKVIPPFCYFDLYY